MNATGRALRRPSGTAERGTVNPVRNRPTPRFKATDGVAIVPDTTDLRAWYAEMEKVFHTVDPLLLQSLLSQCAIPFERSHSYADAVNLGLSAATTIGPRDYLEALLAVQMIGTHNLALEFLRRSGNPNAHPELVSEEINRATKLLRAFSAQVAALERYRGHGQQHVTVEHVHVNSGGQAVVGAVSTGKGEG